MNDALLAELKRHLKYDPQTGIFTRLTTVGRSKEGSEAGTEFKGYRMIGVLGKRYLAHRLAWLYVHGRFPANEIDHKNRIRSDNRIDNLREATHKQNCENMSAHSDSKYGMRGVFWHGATKTWMAQICSGGKQTRLGYYQTITEAKAAYQAAAEKLFTHFIQE